MNNKQILGTLLIFLTLLGISALSYRASLRRERDVQRNLDLGSIKRGLELYRSDFGIYPLSSANGEIVACADEFTATQKANGVTQFRLGYSKPIMVGLIPCRWGEDALLDVNDVNYPNYVSLIPKDPLQEKGYSYYYLSNGESYWLYGSFEGRSLPEYDKKIKKLKLSCGRAICNTGKASSGADLYNPLPEK